MLPFLVIFAAAAIASGTSTFLPRIRLVSAALLTFWLAIITLIIFPDFLAYFNILAGGPENGWQSLVDSNLDWGQDLDDLPGWMARNDVDEVWLSYFGEGRPEYYGIAYQGLDSFPPRLMDPQARLFVPSDPAPGIYAISATNLQGVHFTDHDQFAWFRQQEPLDKLGYSLFIYKVSATGEPATLLLSGVQMDEINAADYALFDTNDVTGRWFDLKQSLVFPSSGNVWLARSPDQMPVEQLSSYLDGRVTVVSSNDDYELARYDLPDLPDGELAEFTLEDGRVLLQQAQIEDSEDSSISITTRWRQLGQPQPLKLFIHATDPGGQLLAQWDGLGGNWQGWLAGDTLVQVHTLTLPDDLPNESVQLTIGVYDPETGQRWLTTKGLDQIPLHK